MPGQISRKDEKEGCQGWKSKKGFKKSAKKDGRINEEGYQEMISRKDIKERYRSRIPKKDEKQGYPGWKSRKGFKTGAKRDGKRHEEGCQGMASKLDIKEG